MTEAKSPPAELPVDFTCPRPAGPRNRLTVFFRPILALPHLILIGGPPLVTLTVAAQGSDGGGGIELGSHAGVLGAVAWACAVIAWFTLVFAGKHPDGLWRLGHFYLRWRAQALAYMLLLRDEYPPFGEDPYPAHFELPAPVGPRDRLRVGVRLLLLIPYAIVFAILAVILTVVTVVAWFSILIRGELSPDMHALIRRFIRWDLGIEAFFLLLRDELPAFVPTERS
ncbi:MAG: DUF4389 domain-containing protein [Myxococcales bacterium]|nr:DUF4389 domain-containing protein [Myxococcales bacterium]MCB9701238.1 DUF4389 domain-containing protein [Myxococcales bacterium]